MFEQVECDAVEGGEVLRRVACAFAVKIFAARSDVVPTLGSAQHRCNRYEKDLFAQMLQVSFHARARQLRKILQGIFYEANVKVL